MSIINKKFFTLCLFLLAFCLLAAGSLAAADVSTDSVGLDNSAVSAADALDGEISDDVLCDDNQISDCQSRIALNNHDSDVISDNGTADNADSNITDGGNNSGTDNNSSGVNNTGSDATNSSVVNNTESNTTNSSDANNTNANTTNTTPTDYDKFFESISNSNGETVYLTKDIVVNKEFTLNKATTIDGNGHSIDGNGTTRIFYTTYALTLKNIILKNAVSNTGGAIYARTDLTIQNCTFINNRATGSYGGAIEIRGGKLIIKDSTFEGNYIRNDGNEGKGGAIYVFNTVSEITNSLFRNNSCISKLKEYVNQAPYDFNGGGIYFHSGSTQKISKCIFTDNKASNHGACFFAYQNVGDMTVTSCLFENNTSIWEDGGALSFGGTKLTLSSSKFFNNFAYEDGGAMDTFSFDEKNKKVVVTVNVNNCVFDSNTAYKGGGVIWMGLLTKYTIKNSNFTNNKASVGGALFATGKSASISNCIFKKNTGNKITEWTVLSKFGNVIQHCGGAIYVPDCPDFKISNSIIQYNNAEHGGGIYDNSGKVTITGCDISHNTAVNGGGISSKGTVTVKSSKINNNKATNGGGINTNGGKMALSGTTIKSNKATYGGGILINKGTVTVSGSTISYNTADSGGGISNKGTLTLKSSKLLNNKATYGGALYINKGSAALSYNTIESNSATLGGAIFHNGGKLTVSSNIIKSNTAKKTGGGIYYKSGTISVKGNAIVSNKAKASTGVHAVKKITVDNNWWGNTKGKAKKAPSTKVVNVKVKTWLHLRISASPAKIAKGKKTTIIIDLRYNNKNKKITSSAKLPVKLTAKSGKIKSTATISKGLAKVKFTKTAKTGKVAANVLGTKVSVTIK